MVAATLATCAYLYLVGIFLVGRWCRDTFLPPAEEGRVEVRHRQRERERERGMEREKPVKMEEEEEEEDGFHDVPTPRVGLGNGSFAGVAKGTVASVMGNEDPEKEKLRRDIERSLQ